MLQKKQYWKPGGINNELIWRYGEFKRSGENHGDMKHGIGNSSLESSRAQVSRAIDVGLLGS